MLAWYRLQMELEVKTDMTKPDKLYHKPIVDVYIQLQRREAAVEFIFCLVLIEVLKQLPFHPGHEDLVKSIENLAFKHFKHRDG